MSLSELQSYASSSDASGDEDDNDHVENFTKDTTSAESVHSCSNFFGHSNLDENSSTDDDEAQQNQQQSTALTSAGSRSKLPSALEALSTATGRPSTIFSNPFKEAEQAECDLLEQHVKLSEAKKKEQKPVKKSRLLCKMFKQGRCKMGDKCRFSHTIGGALLARLGVAGEPAVEDPGPPPTQFHSRPVRYNALGEAVAEEEDEEDQQRKKRKKKVGVNDSLVPPKKALQLFDKLKKIDDEQFQKS